MSKILEIDCCGGCIFCEDVTDALSAESSCFCKKLDEYIDDPLDFNKNCPLPDKEDFAKSLDIDDLCDGVIYYLEKR